MREKELNIDLTEEETQHLYDYDYVVIKRDNDIICMTYCKDDDTYITSYIPKYTKISVNLAH